MELGRRSVVKSALLATAAALVAGPALARDYYLGNLRVSDAWAPPIKPGESIAKVYMIIDNRGTDLDRLLSVRSSIAKGARFIEEDPSSGVIEQVTYLEVWPRRPVTLRPGRIHIELTGVTQPLARGNTFPLTLVFAYAGPVEIPIAIDER